MVTNLAAHAGRGVVPLERSIAEAQVNGPADTDRQRPSPASAEFESSPPSSRLHEGPGHRPGPSSVLGAAGGLHVQFGAVPKVSPEPWVGPDASATPIVVVNEGGSEPPIVFFHTWVIEADGLRRLGAELGPDQPLYGIEHPAVDGPLPRHFEDWTSHHRAVFDRLGLEGPYHLAGHSFGGVIAMEIASQLADEGHEIAWLALIDSIRPKRNPKGVRPYLTYHVQELIDQPDPVQRRAHLERMVLGGGKRTLLRARHQLLRPLRWAGLFPKSRGMTLADTRGLDPLKKAVWRGYLSHRPRYYDLPVTLLVGDENLLMAGGDPSLRWSKYLRGGFESIRVAGKHRELLSPPNVSVVAAHLAASRRRAAELRRLS